MKKLFTLLCVAAVLPQLLTCSLANAPAKLCAEYLVSTSDEVAMGNNFNNQILADKQNYPIYSKNQAFINYIDSIGQSIVKHQTDRPDTGGLKFSFTVIAQDTVVNAFSLLGGHVFVYTGLIKAAKNEAELAAVIAHEIGHITNRHGVLALCASQFLNDATKLVVGDSSLIGQVMNSMAMLQFSKGNEYQADTCAVKFLIASGYNPYGMKTFLGTLKALYGDTPTMFEPFSDHPTNTSRIELVGQAISRHDPTPADSTSLLYADRFNQHKATM